MFQYNNRYLLVIQDCMTKWAETIPITDRTAKWIAMSLWTARYPTL